MPIKFVGGTFQCFINFRNRITLCINGVCLEFLWKFLSHNSKKLRRGTFLFFRNILVSKNCLDKRVGRGGEYQSFPSKKFCITVPKKFGGNLSAFHPVQVSKYFMNTTGMS